LRQKATKTTSATNKQGNSVLNNDNDRIESLLEEYRQLQQRLQVDIAVDRPTEATTKDAKALLDTTVRLTEAKRFQQEEMAQLAHAEMEESLQELRQSADLKSQAEQETVLAVNEVAWLESVHENNTSKNYPKEELEALLLAHAAHDLHDTEEMWQQAQQHRLQALTAEVRAKDLLWYLIEKEENLRQLQDSDDEIAVRKWAEHELPRQESIVQMLRQRLLIDHDPQKGSVAF
jgi:hypothetical protein